MNDEQLLLAVKTDKQISVSAYDTRLRQLIAAAKAAILAEGASTLDPSASDGDAQLVVMYAEWLWESRNDPNAAMPRSLRLKLNNRVLGEKAGAAT